MYSVKILTGNPIRMFLTIGGISLCIVLILFLFGIYQGVAIGSVKYIKGNEVDFWVIQESCTNILRGTSILSTAYDYIFKDYPEIKTAAPVLLLLSTIEFEGKSATVFLAGYNPGIGIGGPPEIIQGRNIKNNEEIVLDNSFAAKYGIDINDTVTLKGDLVKVVGISTGTNAFVIQYAFVSLSRAQSVIKYPNLVTCYLINIDPKMNKTTFARKLQDDLPGVTIYEHEEFLQNNIKEMESGILPMLYSVAIIGAVVLSIILSLILIVNILEKRQYFAIMKMLGAPKNFLPGIIINQSFIISVVSYIIGTILFFPLVGLIEKITPEISTLSSLWHIFILFIIICLIAIVSAYFSIQKLKTIYALEVYR